MTTTTRRSEPNEIVRMPEACPGCSSDHGTKISATIYSCADCNGLIGTAYLGESYTHVLPVWCSCEGIEAEETRYFDLTCLGSAGIERRHGWYHKACRGIVQVG